MDDLTRRFLRLLVARLPEHANLIRATYHDALDAELDAVLVPESLRRARRRPPVTLDATPVDERAQRKADDALRRLGYPIK